MHGGTARSEHATIADAHDRLHGCAKHLDQPLGDLAVLLLEPQLAAGRRAVVGVQHPRDVLELVLELGGAGVVAAVEGRQVDLRRCGRLPQAQRADALRAVTGHHHVVGLRGDLGGVAPDRLLVPRQADVLDPATEIHREADAGARELPRRAVGQPCEGGKPAFDKLVTISRTLDTLTSVRPIIEATTPATTGLASDVPHQT